MPYTVLIVDDSNFFQARLKDIIDECPELRVVGIAANGQEAIELCDRLKPDIVSMDYEMPMMDGVTAVRMIMEKMPRPIVMFSSMTYEGARITLDALEAGAVDFMNKNFAEVSAKSANFKKKFHEKLLYFARNASQGTQREQAPAALKSTVAPPAKSLRSSSLRGKVKLLAIGASTGGPVALANIITRLPEDFPVPVLITQHMPQHFTRAFAERLDRQSALRVREAQSGDRIERGVVLVAPGGQQMMVDRQGQSVKIIAGDERVHYKPSVDVTFASAANAFGGAVLGLVLTGMGSDGREGARLLTQQGSTVWNQDEKSCVVYGMPAAVARAELSSLELPLEDFAPKLVADL